MVVLKRIATALAVGLATIATGCGGSDGADGAEAAAERGRTVYRNVCIACHAADPTLDGSIGPAIAGASRELLEAKVVEGRYPPGYAPKRGSSAAMPRFEYLKGSIDDLAAYLAQTEPTGP